MSKTVFLDFDGTLADHGRVPAAHIDAIQRARGNGHHVLLCTGRPKSLVPRLLRDSIFDGLVCAAGGYIEVDDQVLCDIRFPADVAERTVDVLDENDVTYVLEAPEAVFGPAGMHGRIRKLLNGTVWSTNPRDESSDLLSALHTMSDMADPSFGKAVVLESPTATVDELAAEIGDPVAPITISVQDITGNAGELYLRNVNKSSGIALVAEHYGISLPDIIAIGDGHNDIDMVGYAGIGVAIQGAPAELLARAQLTIPGPEYNGLVEGFTRLGLI